MSWETNSFFFVNYLAHKLCFCVIYAERSITITITITIIKKTNTIMAEVMETQKHYASNAKANAGLTTGKL